MDVEGKHAEAILLAYMEIVQPRQWEVGNDASILGPLSVKPVRRLLIRDQNEFTFSDQECASGSEFSAEAAKYRRPLRGGEQTLALWQVVQDLIRISTPVPEHL
jgi:hypothetical protein